MRSQNLGVYHLDDQERAALARSREEVRQGRFVTDEQMNEIFSRYGA
jgi:predicted transcriptional regulator